MKRLPPSRLPGSRPRPSPRAATAVLLAVLALCTARAEGGTPLQDDATPYTSLAAAHAALEAGQLDAARAHYIHALRQAPTAVEARNGVAVVLLRQGDAAGAASWFRAALEVSPDDPVAHAALYSLGAETAPASEDRLRRLLGRHPDAAALHLALGNLLARQDRWAEAQDAYFRAYTFNPDEPDVLFNLAVGLDHLRQRSAAGFYARALEAALLRPHSFDPEQARGRLHALTATR